MVLTTLLHSKRPASSVRSLIRFLENGTLGCHPRIKSCRFCTEKYSSGLSAYQAKAEFWSQHERKRLDKHNMQRNEFIAEKHQFLVIYAMIGLTLTASLYYFFTDFSFQDNSATHFKAAKRVVYQSPIAKDLIGDDLRCFGVYGRRRKNPYFKVHPLDERATNRMLEMRFHVAGQKSSGYVYAEAILAGAKTALDFKVLRLYTKDGQTWDLRKPIKVKNLVTLY